MFLKHKFSFTKGCLQNKYLSYFCFSRRGGAAKSKFSSKPLYLSEFCYFQGKNRSGFKDYGGRGDNIQWSRLSTKQNMSDYLFASIPVPYGITIENINPFNPIGSNFIPHFGEKHSEDF